jgi:hypothetical protein
MELVQWELGKGCKEHHNFLGCYHMKMYGYDRVEEACNQLEQQVYKADSEHLVEE